MLLTKTVEVKWNKKTRSYYEDKGYVFTKTGDKFKVNINDLKEGSHSEIECLCDYCLSKGITTLIKKQYYAYISQNKKSIIKKDCCQKCRGMKQIESNQLKYGVNSTSQIPSVREKQKQTCIEKYGCDSALKNKDVKNKIMNTLKQKYNCDNVFQNGNIKNKIKETNKKKYGVEYYTQTEEYKIKSKNTCLLKYGVENPTKSEIVKKKIQDACLAKYSTTNPAQNDNVKQKIKETMLERYGVDNYAKTKEYKEKIKQTCYSRYGVESTLSVPSIREKINRTNLKRYGTIYPIQSPIVKQKFLQTISGRQDCYTSKQQIQIYKMLEEYGYNVFINYPYSECLIDIVIIHNDLKIAIEYDGFFWHKNTQIKDRRRDEFLKSKGFKILRIKSGHKVPTLSQILNEIEYLKNNNRKYAQIVLDDWGE